MYRIELINKKTKQVIKYDDVVDLNDGEKMFFKFQINTKQLDDGEYTLNLYDDDVLIKTDTLNVGDFNAKALQYKRGQDIYVETKIDVELNNKFVELNDINTTVYPDDGIDGMLSVTVDATPLYNKSKAEGIEIGYADGKQDGIDEQKEKLTSISITDNGTYTNEDGYNEVIVDVKAGGAFDFNVIGYDDEQTNEANQQINNDIAYSKSVLDDWNDGTITKFLNNYQMVYCPQIDTSKIIKFANFFQNCRSLRKICKISTLSSGTDYSRMFIYCSSLTDIYSSDIDTSKGNNFEAFCEDCSSLKVIDIDMSKGVNFKSAFSGCKSLQSFNLDVSQGTVFESMFTKCSNLKTVSNFITSNATTLKYCFNECENLISVNDLNVPVATDLSYTFNNCKSLVSPPKFLNCVATKFEHCFDGCTKMENVELFNTENATSFYYMFNNCSKLKTIPNFSTSKVSNFGYCLNQTVSLESLPLIDMSSATNITGFFGYTTMQKLTQLGGFKNLKISWTNNALNVCPNLTKESVMNVINNLYDFRGNGDNTTTKSLKLGTTNMAKLTDDEKAIATNKGWVLTS